VVARSIDRQQGAQDAIEFVDFVNRGGDGRFHIVIQNVENRAAPRDLNVFAFAPQCAHGAPLRIASGRHERLNYNTESRSLSAQSDAGGTPASVISVGAICSASAQAAAAFAGSDAPSESCNDQSHRTAQFYSSRGPTLDGRLKPDISGIDGVSITGAGRFGSPFFGTSAAAPHVAAIAALVLHAAPCLRAGGTLTPATARTTVRQLMLNGADPIAPQPDNTFGAGLANAQRAVTLARSACF
jgi:subtilisin family serine protease